MENSIKGLLKIGEIAKITGTAVSALRYYEEIGLVQPTSKSSAQYRYYKKDDIQLIVFIKKAQNIGFTLDEIKLILSERSSGKSPCPKVRDLAQRKIIELREKIKDLKLIERDLKRYVLKCCHEEDSKADEANVCKMIDKVKIQNKAKI